MEEPRSIVEALDEEEDVTLGLGGRLMLAMINEFCLQGLGGALRR
jgi:hypothetical protein